MAQPYLRGKRWYLKYKDARGRWQDQNARKLVLLDLKSGLGEGLDQHLERIVDAPDQVKRIRLRDGRWIS